MSLFDLSKCGAIISRINRLSPDSKPAWGKMNVNQMLCHCADGVKMATGELQVEDKSNFATRVFLKPLVLYVLSIPKGVPTAKKLDQMQGGTSPVDFEPDRRELLACMEKNTVIAGGFQVVGTPDVRQNEPHTMGHSRS